MRIKTFTLLTLALFVMSVVAFAQKPNSKQVVLPQSLQALKAQRTGQLTKENVSAFQLPKVNLPQNMLKAKAKKLPMNGKVKPLKRNRAARAGVSLPATYDFDDGTMQGWTSIDADGDGYCWEMASAPASYFVSGTDLSGTGHNSSQDFVLSGSYSNVMSAALTPDNYLVSPLVPLGGSIAFYACAQDANYAAEHFSVEVSTTSNTDPTAFTKLDEWTMTKSPVMASPSAKANAFRSSARAQGKWYQYVIDLSEYAGQNGYVAIRHFDCSDEFLLDIDDITISNELIEPDQPETPEPGGDLVELPDGVETVTYYTTGGVFYVSTSSGWTDATSYMPSIQVGIDGSDIYIQGLAYYFQDAWIKGTITSSGVATFASGQFIGTDEYGNEYLVGSNDGETLAPIVFVLDDEAGTLTAQTTYILESDAEDEISAYTYWYDAEFGLTGITTVEIPEGLETAEYVLTAYDVSWETEAPANGAKADEPILTEYQLRALVGIDGNTIYAQGLCRYMPEAWVKGVISGTTATFPTGQYFGVYDPYAGTIFEGYYQYPMYMVGYGETGFEDVVFEISDANATLTMTAPDYILINATKSTVDPYMIATGAVYNLIPDVAATPAQPEITAVSLTGSYPYTTYNIPIEDESGNPLIRSKLSYKIYTDIDQEVSPLTLTTDLYGRLEEDMTEIPYTFTDNYDVYNDELYLNQGDFTGWRRIGIQSIYRGGGSEKTSEIAWYALYNYGVSVPAGGYATFYIDDAVTLDPASIEAGAEMFTVTAATEDAVTISSLDAADSNTPLIVYNGGEKKATVKLIPGAAPDEMTTVADEFKGTLEDKTFETADMEQANHYVLNNNNFVWVRDAGTIQANKCWLEFDTGVEAAPLLKIVRNGDATGISTLKHVTLDAATLYDLQGRKLNGTPSKAGIYIQNGKKIVIK